MVARVYFAMQTYTVAPVSTPTTNPLIQLHTPVQVIPVPVQPVPVPTQEIRKDKDQIMQLFGTNNVLQPQRPTVGYATAGTSMQHRGNYNVDLSTCLPGTRPRPAVVPVPVPVAVPVPVQYPTYSLLNFP